MRVTKPLAGANVEIPDITYFARRVLCLACCPVHTHAGPVVASHAHPRQESEATRLEETMENLNTDASSGHTVGRVGRFRWMVPLLAVLAGVLMPSVGSATPAYERRYGVSCTTCHAPLPPRLNNFGIVFRKAGFRLPDSDDDGKLLFETVPARGIGDATSLAADVMARRDKETHEGNRTTFELGEVEALAGTTIGEHLSAQAMFVAWDEGMSELENAEVQYNAGSARHQLVARGGLMQTYLWQKDRFGIGHRRRHVEPRPGDGRGVRPSRDQPHQVLGRGDGGHHRLPLLRELRRR